ncbi:hypothetical protein REPUB_Repub13aG0066400 [Reevesia pubescens]
MSYSLQESPSQDGYPQQLGKPVGGQGGEDPPQRANSRHQKPLQQESPVRVLPQGHLPENNNPDKLSSHRNSQHHEQQRSNPLGVPSQSQKDNYIESHSRATSNQSSHHQPQLEQQPPGEDFRTKQEQASEEAPVKQRPSESSSKTKQLQTSEQAPVKQRNPSESSVKPPKDPPKDTNPTPSNLPIKDHGKENNSKTNGQPKLQAVSEETKSEVDQERKSHSLQRQTTVHEEKPHLQPQQPEDSVLPRMPLPVPDGFPPVRPPTSPSKLEPRPKKKCCTIL